MAAFLKKEEEEPNSHNKGEYRPDAVDSLEISVTFEKENTP